MVDVGVVQEVVRNTICLASTTFNLSEWILGSGERHIPVRRTPSEMSRSSEILPVPGSTPQSPTRQTQPQQQQQMPPAEVYEPMEVPQQQQSAVSIVVNDTSCN